MGAHGDFKESEASRPDWDTSAKVQFTKTPNPNWKFGDGANSVKTKSEAKHVPIDPNALGRSMFDNYKLCISAVTPRPIAFISTRAKDGSSENLAPMSFFQVVNVDPVIFVIGITSSIADAKDTLRNLVESRECVINIVSEGVIEAVNSTCINTPYGVSEWDVSGLTPMYDCKTVSCARVGECIFSIEGKVESIREFDSKTAPGTKSGSMVTVEATGFWAREDAIDEKLALIDLDVLRPISRLGGITYGRTMQVMELPRPIFGRDISDEEAVQRLKKQQAEK